MSARQMQLLGIVLIVTGAVLLGVTQYVLIRWHEKVLREL